MTDLATSSWLITGASGLLGHTLAGHLAGRGARVIAQQLSHSVDVAGTETLALDLTDGDAVRAAVRDRRPDVIVHAAGLTNVDRCESEPALAEALHVTATDIVAREAAALGAKMVYISTDHLWPGEQAMVSEDVPPAPINVYARTKWEGETAALAAAPDSLVLRTNFFGHGRPWRASLSDWIGAALAEGRDLSLFDDAFFTPIALDHLCPLLVDMVAKGGQGVYNAAGRTRLSKYDFGVRLAHAFGYSVETIKPCSIRQGTLTAPRPRDLSLDTGKITAFLGRAMPSVEDGLQTLLSPSSTHKILAKR